MARGRSVSTCMRWLLSVSILLGVLIGWPAAVRSDGGDASLIHACVNPSNLVRIVEPNDGCRPSERSLHWPAASLKGQGLSSGEGLTVVDRTGRTVGPLIRPDAVVVAVNGERVLVGVQPSRFYGLLGVALYYRELNCSGEPLISPATDQLLPWVQVIGTAGYFGGRDSIPYAVGSMLYAGSSTMKPVCYNNTSPYPTYNLSPTRTVDLGGFIPPFSLK